MRRKLALVPLTILALTFAGCSSSSDSDGAGTTTKSTSSSSAKASEEAGNAAQASAIREELLTTAGVSSFSEILMTNPDMWMGYISDIKVEKPNVYVALQVDRKQDNPLGERAAKSLSTLLTEDATQGLNWVIVTDGAGTVIEQEKLNPIA